MGCWLLAEHEMMLCFYWTGLTGCSVLFNIVHNTANIVCEKTKVKHILVISQTTEWLQEGVSVGFGMEVNKKNKKH